MGTLANSFQLGFEKMGVTIAQQFNAAATPQGKAASGSSRANQPAAPRGNLAAVAKVKIKSVA